MQEINGVPLVGQIDGGLERRMILRSVKDSMERGDFRRNVHRSMVCKECLDRTPMAEIQAGKEPKHVRRFRSWSGLRGHLITFHGMDSREVPE